jgi:tagatose 6-phosphate kinase
VIVTVTLNPALHVQYEAARVELGAANSVSRVRYRTGGRGLAVARLLHTFGHEVVAAGLAGGSAGELIRNELAKAGVATQFTRIGAESRRVVDVASSDGETTSFAEPAPYITTEELGRLAADYRSLLDGATAVVLCGSLPDGLPAETYGSLVSYAAGAGVPVVLDAGGSALRHGAWRRPALVIPELDSGHSGQVSDSPGNGPESHGPQSHGPESHGPQSHGPESHGPESHGPESHGPGSHGAGVGEAGLEAAAGSSVVLLAGRSVRALTMAGEWRANLGSAAVPAGPASTGGPAGPARSAMDPARAGRGQAGAFRDALVAGLVPGIALAWSWPDMLRHAVALAASASPGGAADLTAYEALLTEVEISGPGA